MRSAVEWRDGVLRGFERNLCRQLGILGIQECRLSVAVSGGADSVALLRGLSALQEELSLELIAGHVDHGLRAASSHDAAWVAAQCAELGVPLELRMADVPALVAARGGGIEETARRARYELLTQIAVESGCRFLAVGHVADDQAETILHHLLRGTGLNGLRGLPQVRDLGSGVRLIRPLLQLRREEARLYLDEIGQEFREDASNVDLSFTRNRIRRLLLPLLREEFN